MKLESRSRGALAPWTTFDCVPNKTVNRALRSQQLNSCYHCVLSSLLPSPSARDCYLFTQCACARSCGDQRVLSKMPSSQTVHAIYSLQCQLMQSCAQLHASLPPTRDVSMKNHVTDVTPCPNKPPLISLNCQYLSLEYCFGVHFIWRQVICVGPMLC